MILVFVGSNPINHPRREGPSDPPAAHALWVAKRPRHRLVSELINRLGRIRAAQDKDLQGDQDHVAEWLGAALQKRSCRFESGLGL